MTIQSRKEYVYHAEWKVVVNAFQERFSRIPHPEIPSLVEVDIGEYSYRENEDVLEWEIVGTLDPPFPSWAKKIMGLDSVPIQCRSKNVLSIPLQTLESTIRNITYDHLIVCEEVNRFLVHSDNPAWTFYEQDSTLTLVKRFPFQNQIENLIMTQYLKDYDMARKVDEVFIEEISAWENPRGRGFIETNAFAQFNARLNKKV